MENKETNKQPDQQEFTLKLTDEQREQVKRATGKLVTELRVGAVEERANPALVVDNGSGMH
jgi:hypothetical protein